MITDLLLFRQKNPDLLVAHIDSLKCDKFSLVSLIDALSPFLVMESNLRFGSFHLIKMSLFLRSLSRRGVLSPETEIALAKVVVQHLYHLEWIQISASTYAHVPDPIDKPVEKMLTEIRKGNAHNALFYANIALESEKENLLDALLFNGSLSITDTLGHSISCFFPVLDEIVDMYHPSTGTALFSHILYLCRLRKKSETGKQPAANMINHDSSKLLHQAASGTSIVDIHHMITLYIFLAWEGAAWHKGGQLPWPLLVDWINNKTVDVDRLTYTPQAVTEDLPVDYEQWQLIFADQNRQGIIDVVLSLLDRSWQQTCDWLFRVYADYYTPDWDPHYYTSLYAALEIYRDDAIDKDGSKMAIIQALSYFLDNV